MKPIVFFSKILNQQLRIIIGFFLMVLTSFCEISCKKLVETPPPSGSVAETNAFSTDATAIAILNNLYILMNGNGFGAPFQGSRSISLLAGLSSDELTLFDGITSRGTLDYYVNTLNPTMGSGVDHWGPMYNYIFQCNAAIEGLTSKKSDDLTGVVRQQLLGEAQFLRGYFYFNLVNLFGDVPLALTTNSEQTTLLFRSPVADVYDQIIVDLKAAEELLSDTYLSGDLTTPTSERIRPTKWLAKALLAKVYLYTGKYEQADIAASEVINNTSLFEISQNLNDVFLKYSREAIWQLQPTSPNFNTPEAQTYIIPTTGLDESANPVYLSDFLYNSFEVGDLRAKYKNWIDTITVAGTLYRFPSKYKINLPDPNINPTTGTKNMSEYFMIFRLGELLLVRAEAKAQQNKIVEAQSDLNLIKNRAGLNNSTTTDKRVLLAEILHERKVELFTEGANRWFDLKRTETVDDVMSVITSQKSNGTTSWESYQRLYPIPLSELKKAPNLVQNEGYN